MKITESFLTNNKACKDGIDWILNQPTNDFEELLDLYKDKMTKVETLYALWFIVANLNKDERIELLLQTLKRVELKYKRDDYIKNIISLIENKEKTDLMNLIPSCKGETDLDIIRMIRIAFESYILYYRPTDNTKSIELILQILTRTYKVLGLEETINIMKTGINIKDGK